MAILSKGNTFATGEQVTAAKLNNLVDNATFASDAVDNSTTALDGNGKIIVKDGGISIAKLDLSEDSPTLRLTDTDTALSDGELSSNIEFFQSDSSGAGVGASIAAHGDGSTGVLDLRFATGDNTARMAIDGNGKVGIGTLSPTLLFQVVSPNTTTAETVAAFGNQSVESGLQVITNGGSQSLEWGFNALNSRSLVFNTNQTERMKINSSGNIIIANIPTSASGLASGTIYSDSGTLKIVS